MPKQRAEETAITRAGLFILLIVMVGASPVRAARVPFDITMVSSAAQPLHTLADAEWLLAVPSAPAILLEAHSYELHFADAADRHFGPFGKNAAWPHTHPFDAKNFALETSAWLAVPTAGAWTFAVSSDDGFSMTVDGNTFDHISRRAARTTLQTVDFPAAGDYPISLTYFQHLGRSELEVSAAPGVHKRVRRRQGFHLINADSPDALQVVDPPDDDPPPEIVGTGVPEPGGLSLLGVTIIVLLLRRRVLATVRL